MLSTAKGFSLVESLIVIVVLAILLAVAAPNLAEWIASSKLRFKAEGVLNGVALARSNAVKRNARVFVQIGTDSSWTVGCVTAVTADRDGDGAADCPATIEQKAGSEGGSNVSVTMAPSDADTLTYSGLGKLAANGDGSASITQVNFSASATSTVWSLMISGTGQARVCNAALNGSGNPNACS